MLKKFIIILFSLFPVFSLLSKDIYDFALDLYNNDDYYRAISEFKRYIYYYSDSNKIGNAYLYIIKSYYYAEQYKQAVKEAKIIRKKKKIKPKVREECSLFLAKSYLYLGKDSLAFKIFSKLHNTGTSKEIKEKSYYGFIWTQIFKKNWLKANKYIHEFQTSYPESELNKELVFMKNDIKKGVNFSPLSPKLAAVLSGVLPGSGQIYCKRAGDGITAFIFISL